MGLHVQIMELLCVYSLLSRVFVPTCAAMTLLEMYRSLSPVLNAAGKATSGSPVMDVTSGIVADVSM